MLLALGLLACSGLWWLGRNGGRLGPRLTPRLIRRAGAWVALALAAILMLRGQLGPALVLGLGAVWLLDGPETLGARLKRWVSSVTPSPRRHRTARIDFVVGDDGKVGDGILRGGPLGGRRLESLGLADLRAVLAVCRVQDPAAVVPLEAYLDRRHAGWRVDAERDGHPRPGRPAQPGAMTQDEAYQILGLERGATPEAVRTAHRTLMKRAHPDQGGSAEGAARVNAARDRLTNRHR
ncbi:Co-chaperone protein DjlA [Methylobacterium cerastii]|uniref:Co-chaperone protein DjlA n=2 Tax=Methylobacterium TaxID=407 RepID=A0ABQ4QBY6_9HYPH|nr:MULTISPECIES: DnaJ domain-containing protein [Methylobacterium]TXM70077.1 DnaJ domain-containing protein [Methylobacterium sp. WL120]TXM73403.1 DnaJ domain-containing protein [Methylobacterium sp. WL12]TXN83989.1 DnaJ domain-containing protein [Methylobacterium sp. WL8]GJD42594.1 Co-chaperone protein DjlA [Methylobacterium cerastii]